MENTGDIVRVHDGGTGTGEQDRSKGGVIASVMNVAGTRE